MNPDGSLLTNLSCSSTNDVYPACSPNGSTIAFSRYTNNWIDMELWLMDPDGGNQRRVGAGIQGLLPAWSPDGNQLAFSVEQSESPGIYAVNIDGTGLHQITSAQDLDCSWALPAGGREPPQIPGDD